jgi:flagellar biosynthesis protein FlhG
MTNIKTPRAKVIAISSGKGGVGKSNIATNLSISIANAGYKVCLFDADINLANINILLGVNPPYNLQHLFSENKNISEITFSDSSGIDIIAGASGVAEFTNLTVQQQQLLLSALKQLEQNYDYLIIDTAAGIDDSVLSFLHAVPYIIITITKEPTSLTDAYSLLKVLKKQGYNQTVLAVVNMVTGFKLAKHIFTRFSEAVNKYLLLDIRLLGYIVMDENISQAVEKQQALINYFPQCPASMCIDNISKRLLKALENNKISDILFSDFFESLINNNNAPLSSEKLIQEIQSLSDEEVFKIFEKIKLHLNIEQQELVEENKIITATIKTKELQLLNSGLQQAMRLAAQVSK